MINLIMENNLPDFISHKPPMLKANIEGNELVIRVPLNQPPKPSSTGKTLIVASSNGNVATAAVVNGQPVVVGFNAYIKRD